MSCFLMHETISSDLTAPASTDKHLVLSKEQTLELIFLNHAERTRHVFYCYRTGYD